MTQGKHFAAGGDHFAALPNKKIHTPKGIARLTVTAATMAAFFRRPVWGQTIGKQSNERPYDCAHMLTWSYGHIFTAAIMLRQLNR